MGVKYQPPVQGFSPNDRQFYPIWDLLQSLGAPVLIHCGTTAIGAGEPGGLGFKLSHARPIPNIDDVAADFPRLNIVAAHPGWPWTEELIAVAIHKRECLDRHFRLGAEIHSGAAETRHAAAFAGQGAVRLRLSRLERRAVLRRVGDGGFPARRDRQVVSPERHTDSETGSRGGAARAQAERRQRARNRSDDGKIPLHHPRLGDWRRTARRITPARRITG